jgi:hypothetical protein
VRFRTKPVEIEAKQFFEGWMAPGGKLLDFVPAESWFMDPESAVFIKTLEGNMRISAGDFIIRGLRGEYYPCKPDVFALKYEAVTE